MCAYCTEENGKFKYLKECLQSVAETVDLFKNRLIIINNSKYEEAAQFLYEWCNLRGLTLLTPGENLGTARGINLAIRQRKVGEVVIKCDDDVTWGQSGWVEEMEEAICGNPAIGVCGLKRKDIPQNPSHPNPEMRTVMEGQIEWCLDIMGTCTAYNPLMLDKVGGLWQPSDVYGFDDCLVSVRSEAAGFKNCFLPHISIEHLDEGNSEYTEWKKREAGLYLGEVGWICEQITKGLMPYYFQNYD